MRTCLAEAGIKYKSHHLDLPSIGSWETKTQEFLHINPAGTVPVLVHNGHPVYESHEIISYIDEALTPGGPKLIPTGPEKLAIMTKWQDSCSLIQSELFKDVDAALRKRVGNCLIVISIPAFAGAGSVVLSWGKIAKAISMAPLVSNKMFSFLLPIFKIFGVKALDLVPLLKKLSTKALPALLHHLALLEEELEKGNGPWICGDKFTLADVSWVPILDRMEMTTFWDSVDRAKFPRVWQYWENIQARPCFKEANRFAKAEVRQRLQNQIKEWKKEHVWFRMNVFGEKE